MEYEKKILELGAFLDKQFYENYRACNFYSIWLRMLVSFLNARDVQLDLKFKKVLESTMSSLC